MKSRLTILDSYMKVMGNGERRRYARCVCSCGNTKDVVYYRAAKGHTKSCGCISREKTAKRNKKHGLKYHVAYNTYRSMMARCYNEKHKSYNNYGGRGIRVCEEWHDIENFVKWCEDNGFDEKLQIDRIDNDGNYQPDNCRFVEASDNLKNRRNTHKFNNEVLVDYLRRISNKYNVSYPTLQYRYYKLSDEGIEPHEHELIYNNRWQRKA